MLREHTDITIVNLDKLTYAGNLNNLLEVADNPRYTFIKGDICNPETVATVFSLGITHVVNFAAESHVDRSINDPTIFINTNVLGTQVLLENAKQFAVDRFIQISTDEVYGSLGSTGFFTETTPLTPNNPYAASKGAADLLVRAYYQTYGLPINITRCSNNYGPYQFPEKLIPLVISNALIDQQIPVYGDGLNIRDWLYVEDHCRAIDLILSNGRPGEVYNIGANTEKTNLGVVKSILAKLGKDESLIKFVTDRPGHDRRYAIDASKIKQELGWEPRYSFTEGIAATIQWYLENRWWWGPLKR